MAGRFVPNRFTPRSQRASRVAVDVGFKMGDGIVKFWKHAYHSEPVAVYSTILAFLGPLIAFVGPQISKPQRYVEYEKAQAAAQGGQKKMKDY